MDTITLQTLRTKGSKAISDEKAVYLVVNSELKSVLVPPAEYAMLQEILEEYEDMKYIEERRHEKTVGWNTIFPKKKL